MTDIGLNLSGVRLVLCDLDAPLAERCRREWQDYLSPEDRGSDLRVQVTTSAGRTPSDRFAAIMTVETRRDSARFALPEGQIELDDAGSARLNLAALPTGFQFYTTSNLLCAALAWILPSRGSVLLHAAGIVLNGRAIVLVGPSGSGKTTWAGLAKQAGATFLSDDLLFIDASGATAEVLSMPFRADHPVPHGPARWPLAAILLPVHGSSASLAAARKIEVLGRLTANLPFVSDRFGEDPRLAPLLERLVAKAPAFHFTFGLDRGFLECLEPLTGSGA